MKNNTTKKVYKKFSNFSEEEQWLQYMLSEGWVLTGYDLEDVDECQYVFERLTSDEQKSGIYKIDYRSFNRKAEYEEYKVLFEDTGWTLLSKSKWYTKHIFYTTSANASTEIFSDSNSYKAREKRIMDSLLTYLFIGMIMLAILITLYFIYERAAFMGVGLFVFAFNIKFLVDYYQHRKVYKSLLDSEFKS